MTPDGGGVEPWDTAKVKAELEKRGLDPQPDMNGKFQSVRRKRREPDRLTHGFSIADAPCNPEVIRREWYSNLHSATVSSDPAA